MYNVSYVHSEGTKRNPIHNQLYLNALNLKLVFTLVGRRYLTDMYNLAYKTCLFLNKTILELNVLLFRNICKYFR